MPREDRVNYIIRKIREERASNNEVKTYTDMDGEEWTDDTVNHPPHYNKGIATSTYIKSWEMNWNQANVVKYISRYNLKYSDKKLQLQDLEKAQWYLEDLIKDLEKNIKLL